jgi:hypothetical protein
MFTNFLFIREKNRIQPKLWNKRQGFVWTEVYPMSTSSS